MQGAGNGFCHFIAKETEIPRSFFDTGRPRRAHLIGIAGSGMRALASVLLARGWRLSGSDLATAEMDRLIQAGIACFCGHSAAHVGDDVECVVYSSAVPACNPEIRRAQQCGLPLMSYAQMLGALMFDQRGLAVAGTHGKSTTTAMAADILVAAGCDPTVVYGAAPLGGGEGGRLGNGPIVLVEACEFQRNFLHLCPSEAVILNIEPDHFDCYDSSLALEAAFGRYAALLPPDGRLIVPWGDSTVRRVSVAAICQVETFGCDVHADWSAASIQSERGRYRFKLLHQGCNLGQVELSVYGRHNVMNSLAAAALAARSGVEAEAITGGLSRFCGLRRRLELLGTAGGVFFWDDYAHHPTAVSATLQALRETAPAAKLFCLFQPHQSLRTARLLDELARSLQNAERVLIADIYRAREGPPRPGEVTAGDLAARARLLGQDVPGLHAPRDIQEYLQTHLTSGDLLVVMGAGDIGRIGYGLMEWFREHRAAG